MFCQILVTQLLDSVKSKLLILESNIVLKYDNALDKWKLILDFANFRELIF